MIIYLPHTDIINSMCKKIKKKGFFGMFLSSKPIQDSLKKNLIGK